MRAMFLKAPKPAEERPLEMAELPNPEPGPGEVRVRVQACGVCRTDLHIVEGDLNLPKIPVVPGHQIVGVVDLVGRGVTRFLEGDRVGIPWLYDTCGECRFCRKGRENLCDRARFTGLHVDGGFAEYFLARADFAYPVPEGFPDLQAAPLLCAGVIGYRALRLSDVKPGERLGMYGFGASAHVTIQVARYWGCEVFAFTRSSEHRQLALKLGAAWAGGLEHELPVELDSAIIFAPAGPLVPLALRALRKGGTLALAGIYMTPIPQMDYQLLYGERTVRSVANSTRKDAEDLLKLAAEIPIRTEVEVYPLEQANEVLLRLKRSEIEGAAVLRVT
ncbi:MAG TPA: zinc-binding alcohol dehydrogenase family protein [Candidatus Latescibacteria bacterium]|nr:zinc-binding alcohol dehydrogenase family protein [Candidatus Latescibacterota bacterium]